MRTPLLFSVLLAAALGSTLAQAQDALVTKRQTTLRDGPGDSANTLASLPAQTALTRQPARQGPWVQVKTAAGATGWIHMFDVGTATEQGSVANAATGALRGLSNLFNRGSAQPQANGGATATVGIRGLSSEDLANAQPNLAALSQAEGQRQDASQAKRFATEANLSPRTVEPLPEPAPPAPAPGPRNARDTGFSP
ncbi:SH3 domain-containing protein [uncultured Rhodoferax sp.]|uniref:SH3 domain-containing protein n=1 Tax=uncultured Rhodoferax sp. TaxID=223188 RepID=UPI0025EE1741|nr:SH3 domain-containing protein [uncultured Rhodoferax sp.]